MARFIAGSGIEDAVHFPVTCDDSPCDCYTGWVVNVTSLDTVTNPDSVNKAYRTDDGKVYVRNTTNSEWIELTNVETIVNVGTETPDDIEITGSYPNFNVNFIGSSGSEITLEAGSENVHITPIEGGYSISVDIPNITINSETPDQISAFQDGNDLYVNYVGRVSDIQSADGKNTVYYFEADKTAFIQSNIDITSSSLDVTYDGTGTYNIESSGSPVENGWLITASSGMRLNTPYELNMGDARFYSPHTRQFLGSNMGLGAVVSSAGLWYIIVNNSFSDTNLATSFGNATVGYCIGTVYWDGTNAPRWFINGMGNYPLSSGGSSDSTLTHAYIHSKEAVTASMTSSSGTNYYTIDIPPCVVTDGVHENYTVANASSLRIMAVQGQTSSNYILLDKLNLRFVVTGNVPVADEADDYVYVGQLTGISGQNTAFVINGQPPFMMDESGSTVELTTTTPNYLSITGSNIDFVPDKVAFIKPPSPITITKTSTTANIYRIDIPSGTSIHDGNTIITTSTEASANTTMNYPTTGNISQFVYYNRATGSLSFSDTPYPGTNRYFIGQFVGGVANPTLKLNGLPDITLAKSQKSQIGYLYGGTQPPRLALISTNRYRVELNRQTIYDSNNYEVTVTTPALDYTFPDSTYRSVLLIYNENGIPEMRIGEYDSVGETDRIIGTISGTSTKTLFLNGLGVFPQSGGGGT